MRRLVCALFMLLSMSAIAAGQDDELQRLYSALNMLNQEQLSIYQQFQMVQELRRSSTPYGAPLYPQVIGYEEAVEAQRNALQRDESLYRQAGELLTKYNEIEDQKRPLQARIYELSRGK